MYKYSNVTISYTALQSPPYQNLGSHYQTNYRTESHQTSWMLRYHVVLCNCRVWSDSERQILRKSRKTQKVCHFFEISVKSVFTNRTKLETPKLWVPQKPSLWLIPRFLMYKPATNFGSSLSRRPGESVKNNNLGGNARFLAFLGSFWGAPTQAASDPTQKVSTQ